MMSDPMINLTKFLNGKNHKLNCKQQENLFKSIEIHYNENDFCDKE